MKKNFFLFGMLASVAASATVKVTPLSTDYAAQKITFKVEWTNTPTAPYNNRVWVWIDFCPISGITPGSFAPATITGSTITSGSGSISNLTGRGFFIVGSTINSGTTVTAILNPVPAGKFNWCVYGSDYPPNATAANGTYTLKGTPPFVINGTTTLGEGVKIYSGGCITSLTDKTGYPGIINNNFSAGAINNGSSTIQAGTVPSAITSNTAASSSLGGVTYRWVRSGTSNNTYTDNSTGHNFTTTEINTGGTWTYYREVRDNTCATTTWSRSSGSYRLVVIPCPYTGSDLYMTSSYPCQQRTSGAKNWQAYIKDTRDNHIYRIVQMPTNTWWMAEDLVYAGYGEARSCSAHYGCGRIYNNNASGIGSIVSDANARKNTAACPSGWLLPSANELYTYVTNDAYFYGPEFGGADNYALSLQCCFIHQNYCGTNTVIYNSAGGNIYQHMRGGYQYNKGYNHINWTTANTGGSVRCVRDL
jgi:hypothetical protein